MNLCPKSLLAIAASAAIVAASPAAAQTVIYVDDDAPAGGNGASWASAYSSLHSALAVAVNGDEVRVAQGRYAPAGPGGLRNVSFVMNPGVRLVGGFAGLTGPDPDERNPAVYVTRLTGDLNNNDGPNFTNIGDNSHRILNLAGIPGPSTRIDGIHFSGGNTAGSLSPYGAAVFVNSGSPTFVSCTFTGNAADGNFGGGPAVCVFLGSPTFIGCNFTANRSRFPTTFNNFGGAIFTQHGTFTDCVFANNLGYDGGAVYADGSVTMTNCVFVGNQGRAGGAVHLGGSAPVTYSITNCEFRGNAGLSGGGITFNNPFPTGLVSDCIFVGNTATHFGGGVMNLRHGITMVRCIVANNSAGQGGGGIGTREGVGVALNCTIAYNSTAAAIGGGVMTISSDSTPSFRNCILWENTSSGFDIETSQIARSFASTFHPSVNYTCVQGLSGNLGGVGNIGSDPLFMDPLNGDFSLASGSPCINAGDPDPIYNDPDGSRSDMGAVIGVQNAKPDAVAVCQQLTGIGGAALVRLDASGSSDPDSDRSELLFEWYVDGDLVCSGGFDSCGTIDVAMPFGVRTVTLVVTDAGGLWDEDAKVLTLDPASLALFQPTNVQVNFGSGEVTYQAEISLPSTVSHGELARVMEASLSIGGVEVIPAGQYGFSAAGPGGSKWRYAGSAATGVFSKLDVDWGGARFLYRPPAFPVRLQSDAIMSSESILDMDFNYRRTGAFTLTIDGVYFVSVAANGAITANVPYSTGGNQLTATLPVPILPSTTFVFSGSVSASFAAADYLSYSVGRLTATGLFDPALLPDGSSTAPREAQLSVEVGAQGYPGTATAGPSGITVRQQEWRFR